MAGSVGIPNIAATSVRRLVVAEVRSAWTDNWTPFPEFEPLKWSISAAGAGAGTCVLRYRYGNIKEAWASSYSTRTALVMGRNWVRLQMAGDRSLETVWQGAFHAEPRDAFGSSDGVARGQQTFVAHDALAVLGRIDIYQSYWDDSGSVVGPLDHMPHINMRGKNGLLVGNRSSSEVGGSYLYGGTDEWTSKQYIEYVLERFVNATDRPTFTLGGQTDLLDNVPAPVPLRPVETALGIIRTLIAPEFGVDFVPIPTEDGWELRVFSLVGASSGFASGLLPNNPNEFDLDVATDNKIAENGFTYDVSSRHLYDKLLVVGERIVSCFSLYGLGWYSGDLVEGWTATEETAYEAGTGTPADSTDKHDMARKAEKYRNVYQRHIAASTWDWQGGLAAPDLDLMGNIQGYDAERQDSVRETLRVLPLRDGWDYSTDPPTNNNPSGVEGDFKPPFAIASRYSDALGEWIDFFLDKPEPMADADGLNLKPATINVLENELGLLIEMDPNHALANGHWAVGAAETYYTLNDGIDYDNLVLTIAARTDRRLALGLDVPDSLKANDGSLKVIEVPGAEYWYLAPYAAIDIDETMSVVTSPSSGVVLRNDSSRLADAAAGAFARYLNVRAHAEIRYSTRTASAGLLGQILSYATLASADTVYIGSPITFVEWDGEANGGAGITTVKTGYAR